MKFFVNTYSERGLEGFMMTGSEDNARAKFAEEVKTWMGSGFINKVTLEADNTVVAEWVEGKDFKYVVCASYDVGYDSGCQNCRIFFNDSVSANTKYKELVRNDFYRNVRLCVGVTCKGIFYEINTVCKSCK